MALVNYATREINAKIVYYGPGLSGKTTNIHYVFARVNPKNKGKLISLATQGDRTLFFDFLPVEIGSIKGFRTRFHLYTVPGQVFYNSTRKMVLKGADGVVFVADSQIMMMDENLQSLENLKNNLADMGIKFSDFPVIIQYNKRDLPNAANLEEMNRYLNPTGLPYFEAKAISGEGVLKTLTAIVKFVLHDLKQMPTTHSIDFEAIEEEAPAPAAAASIAPPEKKEEITAEIPRPVEPVAVPEPVMAAQAAPEPAAIEPAAPAAQAVPETPAPLHDDDIPQIVLDAPVAMDEVYEAEQEEMAVAELPEITPELMRAMQGHEGHEPNEEAVLHAEAVEVPEGILEAMTVEESPEVSHTQVDASTVEVSAADLPVFSEIAEGDAPAVHEEAGVELPDIPAETETGWMEDMPEAAYLYNSLKGPESVPEEIKAPVGPQAKKTFTLPVRLTANDGSIKEVTLKVTVDMELTGMDTDSISKVEVLEPLFAVAAAPSEPEPVSVPAAASVPAAVAPIVPVVEEPKPPSPERQRHAPVPLPKPKAREPKLSMFQRILGKT